MSGHISSRSSYFAIFAALITLTALTVGIAFVDLGPMNTFVALLIAGVKATLVVLFFMHVRHSSRLTAMVVVSGLVWLFILFAHTLSDYMTRAMMGVPGR